MSQTQQSNNNHNNNTPPINSAQCAYIVHQYLLTISPQIAKQFYIEQSELISNVKTIHKPISLQNILQEYSQLKREKRKLNQNQYSIAVQQYVK